MALPDPVADLFDPRDVFARIAARVSPTLTPDALDIGVTPVSGDHLLNKWTVTPDFLGTTRIAAVLVGLVQRPDSLHVLLTQRTATLRDHSGQIAFPGGKMDPGDVSPAATAIREAGEEVGLPESAINVLGYLDPYLTRTGFRIVPVVAKITPPFDLAINPDEVAEAFEVPFPHLMNAANHQLNSRRWQDQTWQFYAMVYGERTVWGITAGILRILYERLYL